MLARRILPVLQQRLCEFPVVALLGPRQAGKTTLAKTCAAAAATETEYLDLERPSDSRKLADAERFLGRRSRKLVVLDEVQRQPDLFRVLRGLVDERIAAGERAGHFLVLGSASKDLLRQSSESLAGRICYLELTPFLYDEVAPGGGEALDRLWLRGGFPPSYLAASDAASLEWRTAFVSTYLERDLPQLGLRIPAEQVRRFWSMLALGQGGQLNAARLAGGLGVSGNTVRHWLDLLTDLFVVRQLPAWTGRSVKRLVKSPKVYVRDCGIAHMLATIEDLDDLLGHPLCGPSWEGFVIENVLSLLPATWRASYYRTSSDAEIDLVLEGSHRRVIAVEIKRSLAPVLSKGFRLGFTEVRAKHGFIVMPHGDPYPLAPEIEATGASELLARIAAGAPPFHAGH
jgi:predicted AAA+ superfamily ATPase